MFKEDYLSSLFNIFISKESGIHLMTKKAHYFLTFTSNTFEEVTECFLLSSYASYGFIIALEEQILHHIRQGRRNKQCIVFLKR